MGPNSMGGKLEMFETSLSGAENGVSSEVAFEISTPNGAVSAVETSSAIGAASARKAAMNPVTTMVNCIAKSIRD